MTYQFQAGKLQPLFVNVKPCVQKPACRHWQLLRRGLSYCADRVYFSGEVFFMSKKSKKKLQHLEIKNVQQAAESKQSKPTATIPIDHKMTHVNESLSDRNAWLFSGFFLLISFVLYANTFQHDFVLDDQGIIPFNEYVTAPVSVENTKALFSTPLRYGDGSNVDNSLYRPFVKLFFNLQWNFFDGNPHHFHKMNVLLYGLLCMLIFWVLYDLFDKRWMLPFFITLLFTVHPIHTEVVANIKSQDEIIAMLGIVGSLRAIQLYLTSSKVWHWIWGIMVFAIALFSKESAVLGIGLIALLIYFQTNSFSLKKTSFLLAPFLLAAIVFVMIRSAVLSEFPANNPLSYMDNVLVKVGDDTVERFATAVMLAGYYLYTFLVPYSLSCDYSYPTHQPVGLQHWGFFLSFALLLFGLFVAITALRKKEKVAFGLLWFFITFSLISNIFFLIGTSFGERLLFTPSLGLCIALVILLARLFQREGGQSLVDKIKKSPVLWLLILFVSLLYSVKTIDRNQAWETDYKLFSTDVATHPNAVHLLSYLGNHFSNDVQVEKVTKSMRSLGFNEQQIADSIQRNMNLSIDYFQRLLKMDPNLTSRNSTQLGLAYVYTNQVDSALKYLKKAYDIDSSNPTYCGNLGVAYFNKQQYAEAMPLYFKAHQADTANVNHMNNIGLIYASTQRADSAIFWFTKAHNQDRRNTKSLELLVKIYNAIGDTENAAYYSAQLNNLR